MLAARQVPSSPRGATRRPARPLGTESAHQRVESSAGQTCPAFPSRAGPALTERRGPPPPSLWFGRRRRARKACRDGGVSGGGRGGKVRKPGSAGEACLRSARPRRVRGRWRRSAAGRRSCAAGSCRPCCLGSSPCINILTVGSSTSKF